MHPTSDILKVWKKFDQFPMETLTKAWYYHRTSGPKQRSVELMREHREQYGIAGNCFDLAIWLLDEFKREGIQAYLIGHDIDNERAHVGVIAVNDKGQRYLCDLGDQWLLPILIDSESEEYTDKPVSGFFPGANVQVKTVGQDIEVYYHRPNGKVSKQTYSTEPIEMTVFMKAAEACQHLIKGRPLLECRLPYKNETAHWEFYNWESFLSTTEGLFPDSKLDSLEEWVERIHQKTGYDRTFLSEALEVYKKLSR
ncbi:hypothetical protein GCM10008967_06170 [Bacillus carboniphilus]|uniref:Transglutaminase-like domain-containing protein n=1 Tax=Bacillus carboniphilus TaxID=86663 RepID=A0ABP3FHU9_9BACI